MAARRQAGAEGGEADRGGARAGRGEVAAGRARARRASGARSACVRRAGRRRGRRRAGPRPGGRPPSAAVRSSGSAGRSPRSHRHAERGGDAGQHVGEGGRAVAAAPPGPAGSGVTGGWRGRAGRWRCRGRASCSARASSRARTARRVGAGGRLEQVGDDGDAAPLARAADRLPRRRASRSCGAEPAARGPGAGRGRVAVLEQGQRLDRVAADGPGQHGAGAVGAWRCSPDRRGAARRRSRGG